MLRRAGAPPRSLSRNAAGPTECRIIGRASGCSSAGGPITGQIGWGAAAKPASRSCRTLHVVCGMSRPLKRKRAVDSIGAEEATGGMEDLLQDAAIDTRVALEMLAEQFPRAGAPSSAGAACAPCKLVPAPVVLKHQLYTVLADRTATDRELELLRSQGFVRAFKLNTPTHDEVVMLASDYDQVVRWCGNCRAHGLRHSVAGPACCCRIGRGLGGTQGADRVRGRCEGARGSNYLNGAD